MMFRTPFYFLLLFIALVLFASTELYAQDVNNDTAHSDTETGTAKEKKNGKKYDFTLRWGEGGFSDSRSPLGVLGGGQLTLDIKPRTLPVALSLSGEHYTNSPAPTHSYEIADITFINMLYMAPLFNIEKTNYFIGGGGGWIKVPKDVDDPDPDPETIELEKGNTYNLEAGIDVRYFERFGFYGVAKYLYAQKSVNNIKVIDFSEKILMFGVTYHFSF